MIFRRNVVKAIIIATTIVTSTLFVFTTVFTAACWDSKRHFKGLAPELDTSLTQKLFNRLYFTALTMSTTGYGDITPRSGTAKACVIILMFVTMVVTLALIAVTHL